MTYGSSPVSSDADSDSGEIVPPAPRNTALDWFQRNAGPQARELMTEETFFRTFKFETDVYVPPRKFTGSIAQFINAGLQVDSINSLSIWLRRCRVFNIVDRRTLHLDKTTQQLTMGDCLILRITLTDESNYTLKRLSLIGDSPYDTSRADIQKRIANKVQRYLFQNCLVTRDIRHWPYRALHDAVVAEVLEQAPGFFYRPGGVGYRAAKRSFEEAVEKAV